MQLRDPNGSSQSKPLTVSDNWIHDPSDQGTGTGQYHVDGILMNDGGATYMTFNHNAIVAAADTNALALQTDGGGSNGTPYDHVTITNNYFSGYGYMVNSGGNTKSTNMTFTGNVWGTDFKPGFGPLYGDAMYTTAGLGGLWQNNKIMVKAGTTWMAAGNNGRYWWPTDSNPSSSSQIVGHTTDYTGP